MRQIGLIIMLLLSGSTANCQFDKMLDHVRKIATGTQPISTEEIAQGLKEALTNGASKSSEFVSQVDGYFKNPEIKIPFPPDVKKVEDRLRQMGMGAEVDKFVLALNRGAEDAAKEAKPILVGAIKQMTIDDAVGILKGQPDAATQYLKKTTTLQLKEKFKPIVQTSLNKVAATQYYGELVGTYNRIPFVQKVNPDLNSYATDMAMQGLFTMIAKEEKNIRQDPGARTTELLKKVFGSQGK